MLAAACLLLVLFSLLLFQIQSRIAEKKENANGVVKTSKKLIPLPKFSILTASIWLFTFGNGRVIKFFSHIGQRYTVVQTRFFNISAILINDYRLGKDVFNKSVFSGKPTSEFMSYYAQGPYGIFFTQGEQWRVQSRFSHQHLKQFGFNTHSMEHYTQNEIDDLIKSWCDRDGKPFAPHMNFYLPMLSTIWVILAGERASNKNKKLFQMICNMFAALSKTAEFPEILLVRLPIKLKTLNRIVNWIPFFPGIKELQSSAAELRSYLSELIESKKLTIGLNKSPSNLIEAYLMEIEKTTDPTSGFYGSTGEQNLLAVIFDFFVAGGDTTASTLAWCMLHLMRNPEIQEKIRTEVEMTVGANRRPLLGDRINCPYTQAFIWEVLRFSPFAALGMPHEAMEDTNIGQYEVKKGTAVFLNIFSIHHDPRIWGDPQNFRPERFLSADGQTCVRHEAFCAFAVGQRRCPGEQLALDNLFLFVSAICQRFLLKPDPLLKELPEIRERSSIFHVPDAFKMVALDRLQGGVGPSFS